MGRAPVLTAPKAGHFATQVPRPVAAEVQMAYVHMQALQATAQRYSPEEVAVRAVPALAPLSVDAVAQVCPWCHAAMSLSGSLRST